MEKKVIRRGSFDEIERIVGRGKKNLSYFHTWISTPSIWYKEPRKIDFNLEFQGKLFFFFLYCIPLITKIKLSQGTIDRNLIVFLKNGKKVSYLFNTANAWVLTATLWFCTRGCNVYVRIMLTVLSFDYLRLTLMLRLWQIKCQWNPERNKVAVRTHAFAVR